MFLIQSKSYTETMYGKQRSLRSEINGPKLVYQELSIIGGQNNENSLFSFGGDCFNNNA